VAGLTEVSRIVMCWTAESCGEQERDEFVGCALIHTQTLWHDVRVIKQLEQGRAGLVYRADDSAALPRQSSQQLQHLLCSHVVESAVTLTQCVYVYIFATVIDQIVV
jgi:hypothetical protein